MAAKTNFTLVQGRAAHAREASSSLTSLSRQLRHYDIIVANNNNNMFHLAVLCTYIAVASPGSMYTQTLLVIPSLSSEPVLVTG